jgi:hypothetical protein
MVTSLKLVAVQLVTKLLTVYGTRRFVTAVKTARYWAIFWVASD